MFCFVLFDNYSKKNSWTSVSYKGAEKPLVKSYSLSETVANTFENKAQNSQAYVFVNPRKCNIQFLLIKTRVPEMRRIRVDTARMFLCNAKFPSWISKMSPFPELTFFYKSLIQKVERFLFSMCAYYQHLQDSSISFRL